MTNPVQAAQLERVGQISINVHDMPRAVRFYRDVLGLRFLFQPGDSLAFFDCGGTRLMLGLPDKPEYDHPGSILYYMVEEIHAAHDRLKASGATVEGEPHLIAKMPDHDLYMGFFRDSEGNTFALMSEVRPPAAR